MTKSEQRLSISPTRGNDIQLNSEAQNFIIQIFNNDGTTKLE